VGGLGADGYHPLVTLFQAVDLYEIVTATQGRPGSGITIEVEGPGAEQVPTDASNLAYKTAALLAKHLGVRPDVKLKIEKSIPVAGGMAGGSADAAATLLACNNLWEPRPGRNKLGKSELLSLAAELGSDVPFSLLGGTALGTGRGHLLNPIITRGQFHWAFGLSDHGLSTPAVYRKFDEINPEPEEIDNKPEPELLRALVNGDAKALGKCLKNDLQPAALELRPELAKIIEIAQAEKALGVIVSGSGPTVAALAKSKRHARSIAEKWRKAGVVTSAVTATAPAAGTQIYNPDNNVV